MEILTEIQIMLHAFLNFLKMIFETNLMSNSENLQKFYFPLWVTLFIFPHLIPHNTMIRQTFFISFKATYF